MRLVIIAPLFLAAILAVAVETSHLNDTIISPILIRDISWCFTKHYTISETAYMLRWCMMCNIIKETPV